ncbi:hypothetical protein LR48_Vigan09g166400 [Vigna angularis]|uniref:Uncharacterized protein n=1 Tax=Phaseolus angularis TaxID=3914 RepID=A0A0L9VD78_PHAAN|nr:hypothetical protein LR48_Vigan09g166400 [Vigna angularis]
MQCNGERSIPFCTEQVNNAVPGNLVLGKGVVERSSGSNEEIQTPLKKVLRSAFSFHLCGRFSALSSDSLKFCDSNAASFPLILAGEEKTLIGHGEEEADCEGRGERVAARRWREI